jgi:hypothetical protein
MLKTAVCELAAEEKDVLRRNTFAINLAIDFESEVKCAKKLWDSKSRALFSKVRAALKVAAGDLVRCSYCDDSCADEVEHVWPKNFFPGKTFDYRNYLFACGICNPAKNDNFSVWFSGFWIDLPILRKMHGFIPSPSRAACFIDPLEEDPLDFLWLDISANTFMIVPIHDPGTLEYDRAKYTIDVLRLNREFLVEARKNAYTGFCDRIYRYVDCKLNGGDRAQLDQRLFEMRRAPHQTVRMEMQRQLGIIDAPHPHIAGAPEVFG